MQLRPSGSQQKQQQQQQQRKLVMSRLGVCRVAFHYWEHFLYATGLYANATRRAEWATICFFVLAVVVRPLPSLSWWCAIGSSTVNNMLAVVPTAIPPVFVRVTQLVENNNKRDRSRRSCRGLPASENSFRASVVSLLKFE